MKTIEELLDSRDPAWPLIQQWLRETRHPVEVLPPPGDREQALWAAQVTTRSCLGATVYETGGIRRDHGWLRILGAGHPALPRRVRPFGPEPLTWVVADDVIGGLFVINGGRQAPDRLGEVFYMAPDSLTWEPMEATYPQFLEWAVTASLDSFYEEYRWAGWEREVGALPGDQAYLILPLPIAQGPPRSQRERHPRPVESLIQLYVEVLHPQVKDLPDGTSFQMVIE